MKIPRKARQMAAEMGRDAVGEQNARSARVISRTASSIRSDVSSAYLCGWEDGWHEGFIDGRKPVHGWSKKTPTEPGAYLLAFVDSGGDQITRLRFIKRDENENRLYVEPGLCFGREELSYFIRGCTQKGALFSKDTMYWLRMTIPLAGDAKEHRE